MAENTSPAPKRRNWIKIIGIAAVSLAALLVVLFFVATSSGFIRSVILPKAGKSFGAEVTASDVSLSPFKSIVLRDLKVQAPGREPLFTAKEIIVQYRLMDILKGNFNIDLISVSSPVIALVERPDKTSNLDPIMEALGEEDEQKSEPMNLDLKKLVVTDGKVVYEKQPSADGSYSSEISGFNLSIENLKTGGTGKMTVEALMNMRSQAPASAGGQAGSTAGTIKGAMDIGLTPMLMPSLLKGNVEMAVTAADGALASARGMAVAFDADVTGAEVRRLALRLLQNQETLGEVAASGPFSMEKAEGTLDVHLSKVEGKTFDLLAAGSGMSFGRTAIISTNRIELRAGGQSASARGAFFIQDLSITRSNHTTPTLNFQAVYDATVDQAASNATLKTLSVSGTQGGREFLKGGLTAPMVASWGGADQAVGDSALQLTVNNFNLADWKAFMGDAVKSGMVNSKVDVLSKKAGKQISFSHKSSIENLSLDAGSDKVERVTISLSGEGEAANMEQYSAKYAFELARAGKQALQVSGSGAFDSKSGEARGEAKGAASLPVLAGMASAGDSGVASGEAAFQIAFQQKGESQQAQGEMSVKNLLVKDAKGSAVGKPLEAGITFDTVVEKNVAEIRKAALKLTPTKIAANELLLPGRIDMSDTNATSGNLRIASDAMELTDYYLMFSAPQSEAGQGKAAPGQPQTSATPQGGPAPQPETEAEPMILPLTNFVVEAAIKRLTVVEIEITNFNAVTRINGGRVEVNPFEMRMNGAPVASAISLDMGVPGYKYDIGFGMTNVPFAPLVNTFVPDRKGQIGGTISASTQIKGAGTTGASLQKNLAGHFDIATTNLNLAISEMRSPMLKSIVNVIAVVPAIVKNPTATLSSLAGALSGGGQGSKPGGAWSDELLKSPINVIEGNAVVGAGNVKLERARVQSPAFEAKAQGTIQLAKVLTNSPVNIPLNIAVRRSLAESINLVPPGTPTNAAYVSLPDYVTVKGTIGEPKTDINKKALLGTVLQQYGGNIPGVDKRTGSLLQGLGGMLSGQKATNTPSGARADTNAPAVSTNSAATNDPISGLLQGILGNRKK